MLGKIKKALANPKELIRDPNQVVQRQKLDNMRRINKKLDKKKARLEEKRKERNKLRGVQCLLCKKCKQKPKQKMATLLVTAKRKECRTQPGAITVEQLTTLFTIVQNREQGTSILLSASSANKLGM